MKPGDEISVVPHELRPTRKERQLLEQLRGNPGANMQETAQLMARIVWARICEPSDRMAGLMVGELGPVRALNFIISGGCAEKILTELQDRGVSVSEREVREALKRWTPRLDRSKIEEDIERATSVNASVITPCDEAWPTQLDDLGDHTPHVLWVRGSNTLLNTASLAIVGARASSAYGEQVTAEFAHAAVELGLSVVSGAAYGIDAVAHRTALASGGKTVAVLAGGIDRNYPASHDALLERIAVDGAVCSEVVPGTAPTRWRFLMRNRLISALSMATLVTEAGIRSGSLNTAGHTSQLGRPLGAVPGPITSVGSLGCFKLINEYDAHMVTSNEDLEVLVGVNAQLDLDASLLARESPLHTRVLDAVPRRGSMPSTGVATRAGVTLEDARTALAELQLLGKVEREDHTDEAYWRLR